MRNYGTPYIPRETQGKPVDNTSDFVRAQLKIWIDEGVLIHPEIAWEIAAWWQSGSTPALTRLAANGSMQGEYRNLIEEISRERLKLDLELAGVDDANLGKLALGALRCFVNAVKLHNPELL